MVDLSLVIPAYNEASRLETGYARLAPVIEAHGEALTEVVLVDDGSTDGTREAAQRVYGHLEHLRVIVQPANRGKGAAVRLGIGAAHGARVVVADADMSIDPVHLPALLDALDRADLAPGSRVLDGHLRYDSALRTLAGRVFNRLVRHYTHSALRDTQCGFKGLRLGPARLLALLGFNDRFAYDAEMLFLAGELGLSVEPVAVTWDDVAGSSVRVGRDSYQMLRDLMALPRTRYVNPVVRLGADQSLEALAPLAREARLVGLVLARGSADSLLVLPREGALGGAGLAAALGGRITTAPVGELRGRSFEAV